MDGPVFHGDGTQRIHQANRPARRRDSTKLLFGEGGCRISCSAENPSARSRPSSSRQVLNLLANPSACWHGVCRVTVISFIRQCLAAIALACAGFGHVYANSDAPATNRFGFTGPEIFPIEHQISHLRMADLDQDGLQDLVVVNNNRSKINLLYNQTRKTNATQKVRIRRELNELPPDARFRIESIASEKRITGLVVGDFTGDGRPDIAYYGEPREFVLIAGESGGTGWASQTVANRRRPIDPERAL
jgi:hypothetical protein